MQEPLLGTALVRLPVLMGFRKTSGHKANSDCLGSTAWLLTWSPPVPCAFPLNPAYGRTHSPALVCLLCSVGLYLLTDPPSYIQPLACKLPRGLPVSLMFSSLSGVCLFLGVHVSLGTGDLG